MWQGPVANWIKACLLMEDMDVDLIIPGHAPITDKHGVATDMLELFTRMAELAGFGPTIQTEAKP